MKQLIMGQPSSDSTEEVLQQWTELKNLLIDSGIHVIETPIDEMPMFVGEVGLCVNNVFVAGKRKTRTCFGADWFVKRDFEIELDTSPLSFGGNIDAHLNVAKNSIWVGFGIKTSGDFKFILDSIFENSAIIVRPLELIDTRFSSLSSCFCQLDTGELMWYPPAFSAHARTVIELWFENKMIKISEEDALAQVCGSISNFTTIIAPKMSNELKLNLERKGYKVKYADISAFIGQGRNSKWLVNEVNE